jgi:hypothetical protein
VLGRAALAKAGLARVVQTAGLANAEVLTAGSAWSVRQTRTIGLAWCVGQ